MRAARQAAESQQARAEVAEQLSVRQAAEIEALQQQLAQKPLDRIVEHEPERREVADKAVQAVAAELGHDPFVLNLLDRYGVFKPTVM